MLKLLSLLCWLAGSAYSQQAPNDLLERVRDRVRETIQRLPNYMCTQTVDRTQYRPASTHIPSCAALIAGQQERKMRPVTSDRLRLDVAMASSGEIYSWVGESGFHDQTLAELVKKGTTSTGSFAAFLRAIFTLGGVNFSFQGERMEAGRPLAEFAFQVAQRDSQYSFGYRTGHIMTGYHGTFLADPKTAELVRLSIVTDELPDYTESCQASTTLDYARVALHGADFLLPTQSHLRIIDANGVESENRTVFSACHEFLGESTLSFDPSPAEATPESGKANDAQTPFPAGLAFRLALTQDIDVATAAAGDPIRAQLTTPIQDHSSKVLSPSGAAVSGRIAEVRHYYPPTPSWSIVLRLETLKIGGASRPFAAVVDEMSQRLTGTRGGKGVLHWKSAPGTAEMVFGELKPGEAVPSGQEMKWVTVWPSTVSTTKTEPATSQTDPVPAQFRIPQDPTARDDGSRPGLVPADALAPVGPRNLGFQEGAIGAVPAGWDVPTRSKGYSAELRGSGCKIGPMCATILVPPHPPAGSFGNLMQSFDGRPYRGKTIRLHAWLRVDPAGSGNRAQLWVRVDRENGQMGFFDNMGNRPVTSGEWKECEIRGKIDRDAGFLNIGVIALGKGAVWIDGISFEVM